MSRSSVWANKDGLYVGFGKRATERNSAGALNLGGQRQQIRIVIDGATVPDSDVSQQLVNAAIIPAGSLIESAKLVVKTAFAGSNAVMDIGTYNAGTKAAIADNGIDSAIAVTAIDADGDVVACDGASLGVVATVDTQIGVSYDTAAFTAGVGVLTIEYIPAAV